MSIPSGTKLFRLALYALLFLSGLVLAANLFVLYATRGRTFDSVADIKDNEAGLLLGTSRYLRNGGPNPFFHNRIAAAVTLYNAGRIHDIIVSGDNRTPYYNEPEEMKRELVKLGIPRERIYLDYAGRRTLDSVVRCGEVFGQGGFTVISQNFHNRRAVLLGRYSGYDVVGFNAEDVGYAAGFKTRLREYLARVVMLSDLFFGKRPHFLGEKIRVK